jgi:hypothetical protein
MNPPSPLTKKVSRISWRLFPNVSLYPSTWDAKLAQSQGEINVLSDRSGWAEVEVDLALELSWNQ